ncbi:MAG: CBS domain-containing protein [Nitrosarchaeum sp.]|nr:CBS domain-containing protein [Nitrosarchaeum sp.]
MSRAVISVNPATTSFQIAKMMEQGGIGAVLVQEGQNHIGIITDRDYAIKIAANNMPHDTPASDIMSSPLVTISHDKTAAEAARTMSVMKIRKLAVSDNNCIVGIITSTDLVDHLTQ